MSKIFSCIMSNLHKAMHSHKLTKIEDTSQRHGTSSDWKYESALHQRDEKPNSSFPPDRESIHFSRDHSSFRRLPGLDWEWLYRNAAHECRKRDRYVFSLYPAVWFEKRYVQRVYQLISGWRSELVDSNSGSDIPGGKDRARAEECWGFDEDPKSSAGDGLLAGEEQGDGSGLGSNPSSKGSLGESPPSAYSRDCARAPSSPSLRAAIASTASLAPGSVPSPNFAFPAVEPS